MWKFLEDLKRDFEKGLNDIADENVSSEEQKKAQEEALTNGKEAIHGNTIVALHDGAVKLINQDQNQIEIYMDDGRGYGIQFPMGPTAYSVKVSPNQKVKAGEVMVAFGPSLEHEAEVYAFTPDIIKVLTESRFRIH